MVAMVIVTVTGLRSGSLPGVTCVLVHCVQAMGMEVGLLNSDKMKELASQINVLVTKVRVQYTLLLCYASISVQVTCILSLSLSCRRWL